jgi:hypothetical protein
MFYTVMHVVYTPNECGRRRASPQRLHEGFEFMKQNLDEAIAPDDAETMVSSSSL